MDTLIFGVLRRKTLALPTRLALAGLLSTLVIAGVALATTTPASATQVGARVARYPAMATGHYEQRVQHWVNVQRRRHDRRRLRVASCTDTSAERWSGYLARHDLFYHQSMTELLRRCDARYAGETLGRGAVSPRRLVRLWMHSDAHRHVLLSRKSRRIGIGAKPDAYGRWVVAANFMRF